MKILLVGSGAREHAIAWKLFQSPQIEKIFAAPGNPGISQYAELIDIQVTEVEQLAKFSQDQKIDLVVIGPEVPLTLGLADLMSESGISCFGPKKAGALLEGSKKFAKDFMKKYDIPTAGYQSLRSVADAKSYFDGILEGPVVVKADGLAQGKGVVIASSKKEALDAITEMIDLRCFGDAGSEVVVEEFLTGEEVSLLTFVDGKTIVPMLPVQDHKRIGEGDTGLNTGGMGTYAPTSVYTKEVRDLVEVQIIEPLQRALKGELDYCGCLYIGLMLTESGPKVIEFNARFGDPETEVLMPLLDSDLVEIMTKCATGNLKSEDVKWKDQSAVCVIMASKGYPEKFESGFEISGIDLDADQDSWVFHAGTKKNSENKTVTSGGRVLAVSAVGDSFLEARKAVYKRVEKISFENSYYRSDIGYREENRKLL